MCLPLAFAWWTCGPKSWQDKNSLFNPGLFIGTWNLALPPTATVAGLLHLALHPVFSTQAPTCCGGLVASLNFPNTRFLCMGLLARMLPWFSHIPGLYWADVRQGLLVISIAILVFVFFNRVAPVCVYSSIRTWSWGRLFIGGTPPNREAECLVRKGVGLWTIFWAVATPVPASLFHSIPMPSLKKISKKKRVGWNFNTSDVLISQFSGFCFKI